MADITQARKVVIERIVEGDGKATQAQRRAAFDNTGLPEPLRTLVDKVVRQARQVTDGDFTHEAMRGASAWSVGDRELMAAVVSRANDCDWCTKAHTAVASGAYRDEAKVSAALRNLETAPIEEPLRATLRMLRKLAREQTVNADDMRAVLTTGASHQQIEDALAVAFAFNTINRLADAFSFVVPGPQAFEAREALGTSRFSHVCEAASRD